MYFELNTYLHFYELPESAFGQFVRIGFGGNMEGNGVGKVDECVELRGGESCVQFIQDGIFERLFHGAMNSVMVGGGGHEPAVSPNIVM